MTRGLCRGPPGSGAVTGSSSTRPWFHTPVPPGPHPGHPRGWTRPRGVRGSQGREVRRSMGVTLPAFQVLVDSHWRDVARLAHALAGPVDGDDVAQQAWTQALAAYPSVRSSANLRG